MKHQKLLVGLLVTILAAAGVLFFIDSQQQPPESSLSPSSTNSIMPTNSPTTTIGENFSNTTPLGDLSQPSPSLPPIPTGDTLTISGVPVKNFYTGTAQRDRRGDITFVETETHSFTFFAKENSFLISVMASPFSTHRSTAENAFLSTLNISQTDACKLTVVVNTPEFVNPVEAGTNYPLSFCR